MYGSDDEIEVMLFGHLHILLDDIGLKPQFEAEPDIDIIDILVSEKQQMIEI